MDNLSHNITSTSSFTTPKSHQCFHSIVPIIGIIDFIPVSTEEAVPQADLNYRRTSDGLIDVSDGIEFTHNYLKKITFLKR